MRNVKVEKRLEKVIRATFGLKEEEIEENWTSDNIPNWDSVGHLNLILAVENEFNIKFEIEEMFQIKTLGDIDNIVKNKLKNGKDKWN